MRILVTGGRGFVGTRLAGELRAKGHFVKEFDAALGNDIRDAGQCASAVKGIEVVCHLAAVLDERSPELFDVNVKGTERILEAAAKERCRQFVFLSTAGVHGNARGKVGEKSPVKPVTAYEKSKAEAERIVQDAQEMLPVTIIRSALVFGPNKYWREIIGLVRKGYPIIGGGKQQWQTIFLDDLVSALLFVLMKEECFGETFIVAEKEEHSLRDLYAEIQKQLGIEGEIKTVPAAAAKIALALGFGKKGGKSIVTKEHIERLARTRSYDTGKLNALGWKAKTSMREAVGKTLSELSA